jgi:hypothetical protein
MSVGHQHPAPDLLAETPRIRKILHRLLTTGSGPALMKRFQHRNIDCDIAYLAGYNVEGTTRFADRDFVHALRDPGYAEHLIGAPIDTGLSPGDTLECVFRHEGVEKVILDDPSSPFDLYDHHDEPTGLGAHELATFAEHELVRQKNGDPKRYEAGLKPIIHFCARKHLTKITPDYACAPYLDDPDANAKRIVERYRELGVIDAGKVSKESVEYERSRGKDRCSTCAHWQNPDRRAALSQCDGVDGLVAGDRWCKRFEPMARTMEAVTEAATPRRATPLLDQNAHAKWRSQRLQRTV